MVVSGVKVNMISNKNVRVILTIFICLVWFVNGFVCKVLNLVPRHQQIVGRILGDEYAWLLTKAIGIAEILIVVWILTQMKSRVCAIFQMAIIATMNILEFILVPDLLLLGRMNIVFACFFIALIYFNEFVVGKRKGFNQVA